MTVTRRHFNGMSMASIYISSDAYQRFRIGPVQDVVIRNNVFERPAGPVIWFDPTNREVVPGQPMHRNVVDRGQQVRRGRGRLGGRQERRGPDFPEQPRQAARMSEAPGRR
ncbi:hypothetical protein [Streptomyces yanii]|uniref:Right-handed parallel beta-helix repeat-containing protein n=1 Tax=Streptomyces yanii TaxID=78510 RepID=A0ABV5R4S3_9ACTN